MKRTAMVGIGIAMLAGAAILAGAMYGGKDGPETPSGLTANGSPVLGDPNAPITLVEFGDYQCHFCNVFFHSTEGNILKAYVDTGIVKMVFKDYNIIGPDSVEASHGAHCADDQGMFWEYHDVLYSNWAGENNGWASGPNLERFAIQIGLDMEVWRACMSDRPHSGTILASNQDAKELGITGTPAFYVIGPDSSVTNISGAQPYHVFQRVFEEMLEADSLALQDAEDMP